MSGINPQHELARQLYTHVITPALSAIGFNDPVSRILVLSTACKESGLQAIAQYGNGPAVSLWQMEPATVRDTWYRMPSSYYQRIRGLVACNHDATFNQVYENALAQLPGNLYLAAAVCRLIYYLKPFKLSPGASQMPAWQLKADLAGVYKQWYNTPAGAATESEFIAAWDRFNLDNLLETKP